MVDERYVVGPLVGKGAMGAVYRAVHILRRAPVALKVLSADGFDAGEQRAARFVREAVAASMVESEHVVRVLDAGTLDNGMPYIVMELLQGKDMAALLRAEGTPGLPVERALHLIVQVLSALQIAHASAVIHRDMKLSNCFVVSSRGEKDFVKILDFGGSKLSGSSSTVLTTSNFFLGTPAYVAPEQAFSAKSADARSDLFSVGVMLYKLLSGRLPISFENERTLKDKILWLMKAKATPLREPAPHVPEGLCEVVHRAMQRDPAARFESALAFAEALEPFLHEGSRRILEAMRALTTDAPPSSRGDFSEMDSLLASVSKRDDKRTSDEDGASAQRSDSSRYFARELSSETGLEPAISVDLDDPSVTKIVNTAAPEPRKPSAEPESAEPESAEPESAKPESAKPESAEPESAEARAEAPPSTPSSDARERARDAVKATPRKPSKSSSDAVAADGEPRKPSPAGQTKDGYAWLKWGLLCILLFLAAHLVVERLTRP